MLATRECALSCSSQLIYYVDIDDRNAYRSLVSRIFRHQPLLLRSRPPLSKFLVHISTVGEYDRIHHGRIQGLVYLHADGIVEELISRWLSRHVGCRRPSRPTKCRLALPFSAPSPGTSVGRLLISFASGIIRDACSRSSWGSGRWYWMETNRMPQPLISMSHCTPVAQPKSPFACYAPELPRVDNGHSGGI
jgi:hypothetical protein